MAKRRPSGDGMVRLKKENQWEGRIVVGISKMAISYSDMHMVRHKKK